MDDERTVPDDDTELTRITPPDDATRVMPAADEGRTQVMPGADTGATRVMPAAGAATPPPPSQPTLMMTRGRGNEDGGVPWWVWLLIVLAVVAAAAALWYFYLRPTDSTTAGDEFLGNWAPESGSGGGLIIKPSGEQFTISQYDDQLKKVGTTTADLVDGELQLSVQASAVGLTGVTGKVQGTLTHEAGDRLKLQFAAGELSIEPAYFVRVEVLLPATPTPTPTASPSPSVSPTPTATPTTTPTASPSGSPTADNQTVANIAKLQVGIVAWAADNNNLYPPPQDVVDGGGLSQYVSPWPTDPFTGRPMAPGTAPGSYVYEQISGGQAYRLTGYLSNGLTYSVP
jgi:hypothetical protein